MRIGLYKPMPGEVLATVCHTALEQSVHQTLGKNGDCFGATGKSTIADHTAFSVIQIQYGRKTEIHTTGNQLGTEGVTPLSSHAHGYG